MTIDAPYRETAIPIDQLDWLRPLGRRVPSTSLSAESVPIEVVEIIRGWDPRSLVESVPPVYPTSAVDAVDFIRDLLMISRSAVLDALRISEKSFHNWARYGHRPRPSSTGALWPMTEALYRLANGHPNLGSWFQSDQAAQEAFHVADVNALALAELTWAVRTYAPVVRVAPDFDLNLDAVADVPARRRAQVTSSIAPTATRRRR
jgi:hypothetical protein